VGTCVDEKQCKFDSRVCPDKDLCTLGVCSDKLGCQWTPNTCDDGVNCTLDTCSLATGCSHSAPVECDDGDPCTEDSCMSNAACAHIKCGKANACATDECIPGVGCLFTPVACVPGPACAWPTCDPSTGCPVLAGCDDGQKLTLDACGKDGTCHHYSACDSMYSSMMGIKQDPSGSSGWPWWVAKNGDSCEGLPSAESDNNPCTVEFGPSPVTSVPVKNSELCHEGTAFGTPKANIAPMQYAVAAKLDGTLTCDGKPGPYWWAKNGNPVPLPCQATPDCGPAPHADAVVCAGGQCLAAQCATGWQDKNAWGNDGCEAAVAVACDLYVDATAPHDVKGDGTTAHPFVQIESALQVAQPGCVIHIGAGAVYTTGSKLTIATPGVVLRGEGPGKTMIAYVPQFPQTLQGASIQITAADVVLEGLFAGRLDITGAGVMVRHVQVDPGYPFDLINNEWAQLGVIECVRIYADDIRITASTVRAMAPWQAPYPAFAGSPGSCQGFKHTQAFGIRGDSPGGRILGVRVEEVRNYGTMLSASWPNSCNVGYGGSATGFAVGGALASGVEVGKLWPTPGSFIVPTPGTVQWAYPDGAANGFGAGEGDATNSTGGKPDIYLSGCTTATVAGFDANAIRVIAAENVLIQGSTVTGDTGIYVSKVPGVQVVSNTIHTRLFVGESPGAVIAKNTRPPTTAPWWRSGSCFEVKTSANCVVDDNDINGSICETGLSVTDSDACALHNNWIHDLWVESAGYGDEAGKVGYGKMGYGIRIVGPGSASVSGGRVSNIVCQLPDPFGTAIFLASDFAHAAGVSGELKGTLKLDHVEISNICPWSDMQTSHVYGRALLQSLGPVVADQMTLYNAENAYNGGGALSLTNSIVVSVDACDLAAMAGVKVAWSAIQSDTGICKNVGATNLAAAPLFLTPSSKSTPHYLDPASACVNAADPAAPFALEATPNGCRADLGAYGNTIHAVSPAGATNCP
jgi:hypothetical protein